MTDREFHAWLDEVPRTPGAIFVRTPHGETRLASIPDAYTEWRRRAPQRSWRTNLERRTHQLAILTHLLEKEEARNSSDHAEQRARLLERTIGQ